MDRHILLDGHVRLDPGRGGIDDRHTVEHVPQVDPVAQDGGGLGELGPGVDADLERLGGDVNRDGLAGGDEEPDRVGQVDLALSVLRLDAIERRPEGFPPEDVDRGVRLAQSELLRRRVPRLDDSLEPAVGSADEPAVVPRIGVLEPSTVAAVPAARCAATSSRRSSAVRSTASPARTRTSSARPSSMLRAARAASPVPSGCSWTATSKPSKSPLVPGAATTTTGAAPASTAAPSTQSTRRRPSTGWRCFGTAERIRVPRPADITTAAIGVSVTRTESMAGAPGFEPGIAGPKPAALPLGYAPENTAILADLGPARFEPTRATAS